MVVTVAPLALVAIFPLNIFSSVLSSEIVCTTNRLFTLLWMIDAIFVACVLMGHRQSATDAHAHKSNNPPNNNVSTLFLRVARRP
ncbi:hypothetical protein KBC03_05275 [Patescibacteria group bacterium]|nr:hypothetical protein [Patescibacteria group bacterium]